MQHQLIVQILAALDGNHNVTIYDLVVQGHDSNHVLQLLDVYLTVCRILCSLALSFLMPQPNRTKPPLQVLPVVKGNSEKNKVCRMKHVMA